MGQSDQGYQAEQMFFPPKFRFLGRKEVSGDDGALAAEPGGGVRNRMKGQTV